MNNAVRDNLIYKHYLKYRSERALGFCCSRLHAEYMAKIFSKKGIPSVAVYSNSDGEYSENRSSAIKMLEEGKIKVIFSVDMFNEGVDIPEVDAVIFLRPTQSGIVFLQQLGRGLRTLKGKEYLNVLDFIGNYKYAGKNISLLKASFSESRICWTRFRQEWICSLTWTRTFIICVFQVRRKIRLKIICLFWKN